MTMGRYYWKILYDPVGGAGVAVIGINNPHLEVTIAMVCQLDDDIHPCAECA